MNRSCFIVVCGCLLRRSLVARRVVVYDFVFVMLDTVFVSDSHVCAPDLAGGAVNDNANLCTALIIPSVLVVLARHAWQIDINTSA